MNPMPRAKLPTVSTNSASRAARTTTLGRYSWLTLAGTLIVAGVLLTGDLWLTRAGAVVAFLGGLISCLLALREVKLQRASYELASTLELRKYGEALRTEREQHRRLLGVMSERNRELRGRVATLSEQVTGLNQQVTGLTQEVSRLRGDNASLKLELARLNELNNAEVLALPRRVAGPISHSEKILWSEENLPTVVDLAAITAPFALEERQRMVP